MAFRVTLGRYQSCSWRVKSFSLLEVSVSTKPGTTRPFLGVMIDSMTQSIQIGFLWYFIWELIDTPDREIRVLERSFDFGPLHKLGSEQPTVHSLK